MMDRKRLPDLGLTQLSPFGVILNAPEPARDLPTLDIDLLTGLVEEHRVVILRGFDALPGDQFPDFCRRFGELQEWDFGVVNELRVDPQAENYLYTSHAVPFHWDGAFAGRVPRYIIFDCDAASAGGGGETLFCDTLRLLAAAPPGFLKKWREIGITYTTDKVVHYGGTFTSPLITRHPANDSEILRFAEPVTDLNPVQLEIDGLFDISQADFLADMHQRLHDDAFCYRHTWRTGDVMIADNYVLLHGRREFDPGVERRIRRVNVF